MFECLNQSKGLLTKPVEEQSGAERTCSLPALC